MVSIIKVDLPYSEDKFKSDYDRIIEAYYSLYHQIPSYPSIELSRNVESYVKSCLKMQEWFNNHDIHELCDYASENALNVDSNHYFLKFDKYTIYNVRAVDSVDYDYPYDKWEELNKEQYSAYVNNITNSAIYASLNNFLYNKIKHSEDIKLVNDFYDTIDYRNALLMYYVYNEVRKGSRDFDDALYNGVNWNVFFKMLNEYHTVDYALKEAISSYPFNNHSYDDINDVISLFDSNVRKTMKNAINIINNDERYTGMEYVLNDSYEVIRNDNRVVFKSRIGSFELIIERDDSEYCFTAIVDDKIFRSDLSIFKEKIKVPVSHGYEIERAANNINKIFHMFAEMNARFYLSSIS